MKKKIITGLLLLLCMQVVLSSCNKWLDVKPEDKTLEEDIFSHETSINKALNAIYNKLAAEDLYGQQLTKSTLDVMAQYYNSTAKRPGSSNVNRYSEVVNFNYKAIENQAYFDRIWTNGYKVILSTNNFIEGLGKYDVPLTQDKLNILKGEAYGLRALMHFDLLRLYGPVYMTDPLKVAIPYRVNTIVGLQPLLTAKEVIELVIKDLKTAEDLLKNDPIILSGSNITNTATSDGFYKNRNRRMNYYAVLALQARVYLYQGDKVSAAAAAEKVINEASKWFAWKGEQDHLGPDGDRIFSNEVIFGLDDLAMYTSQRDLFDGALNDNLLLAPQKSPNVSLDIYENNAQDFRYIASWEDLSANQAASRPYSKLFVKYKDVETNSKTWRNLQPMVRMSELYFIMAECKSDKSYLNTIGSHRGLEPLNPGANLSTELLKAYRKEFLGEGQLFFYYKRTAQTNIKGYNLVNLAMDAAKYVVPLPLSETNQR
jgi:hypothetical protein